MRGRARRAVLLAAMAVVPVIVLPVLPAAAQVVDRLEAFRRLAAQRLAPTQVLATDLVDAEGGNAYRDIYALLDEEIVDSLASGGPYASPAFLQDRLDGFTDAWGGAFFRIARVDRFLVGAFRLGDGPDGNSVRVYGRRRGEPALLTVLGREGRPVLHAVPAAGQAGAPFVVAWEGAPSGRGTRALRLDLLRPQGDGVAVAWSTADVFPDGLVARSYSMRGRELRLRYELRYPGWVPGCGRQTEHEDVYRLGPDAAHFQRVSRREFDTWHRELRRSVEQLLAALAASDGGALASLVPDAKLRERLPVSLRAEPACDAPEGAGAETVSVAASAESQRPWTLTFRRVAGGWRLMAAAPVEPTSRAPLQ